MDDEEEAEDVEEDHILPKVWDIVILIMDHFLVDPTHAVVEEPEGILV